MNENDLKNRDQFLILCRDSEAHSIKALTRIIKDQKFKIQLFDPFCAPYDFQAQADQAYIKSMVIIPRTSGVLFDDIDLCICEELIHKGAFCPVPIQSIRILRDKDRQYLFFSHLELPMLETLIHRGPLTEKHLKQFCTRQSQWVIKSIRGLKGIGIKRMTTPALLEFWQEAQDRKDQRYLIQPYLDQAREIRVLCLGDQLWPIEKKIGSDKSGRENYWKKNAQFADFQKVQLSSFEKDLFIKHARLIKTHLQLPCFATDYILNEKGQWKILEVNVHPGLESSSQALEKDLYPLYFDALLSPIGTIKTIH